MHKASYKKTIFWRGLILVLVPLLLGLLVLFGLNTAWQISVKSAQEESRQNFLLRQINKTLVALNWRMSGALSKMTLPVPDFLPEDVFAANLKSQMADIKERVKDEPKRLEDMNQLEDIVLSEAASLAEFPSLEPGNINVGTANQLAKTAMKVAVAHTEIRKIFEREFENLKKARAKEDQDYTNLAALISVALLASLGVSCAVVFAFSQSFSRRIESLANKASKLAEQKSIELDLQGNDELSYLDGVLYNTSRLLEESAAHRQSILSMVAHDMRSPLMAAKLSLYMLDQSDEDISDEMRENLADASNKLLAIVSHLDELLEKQRASLSDAEQSGNAEKEETADSANEVKTGTVSAQANPAGDSNTNTSPALSNPAGESSTNTVSAQANPAGDSNTNTSPAQANPAADSNTNTSPAQAKSKGVSTTQASLQPPTSTSLAKSNSLGSITKSLLTPRIFQKSLLLVLIPMLIQGYLISQIQSQLADINRITKMERIYSDMNIYNALLTNDFIRGISLTLAYCLTGSTKCKHRADKIFANTSALYDVQKKVVDGDKQWLEVIELSKATRLQQIGELGALAPGASVELMSSVLFRAGSLIERPNNDQQVATSRSIVMGGFNAGIKQNQIKLRFAKDELDKTFILSLAVNVILAALALLAFSKNIGGRLRLLIDNAVLISDKKTITNKVGGHDEIAYLGKVLFDSHQELERASAERLQLMKEVAHEMQMPLDNASSCITKCKLEYGSKLSPRMMTQIDRALSNIERVTVLIEDLLTMETLESGKVNITVRQFDSREMADAAINAVASIAKKKDIQIENLVKSVLVSADRDRLIQVLVNLVSNAIKFSSENTAIQIYSEDQNEKIKFVVSDQGPGMDEATRSRVFEKYFQAQTPEQKQGFGLGLAICSLIVHTHSGKLGVESELGKGSKFWFSIPKHQPKT